MPSFLHTNSQLVAISLILLIVRFRTLCVQFCSFFAESAGRRSRRATAFLACRFLQFYCNRLLPLFHWSRIR